MIKVVAGLNGDERAGFVGDVGFAVVLGVTYKTAWRKGTALQFVGPVNGMVSSFSCGR